MRQRAVYVRPLQNMPGLRKLRSGHHLVFYLIDGKTVDVLRVLHERRDVKARLRD